MLMKTPDNSGSSQPEPSEEPHASVWPVIGSFMIIGLLIIGLLLFDQWWGDFQYPYYPR